MLGVLVPLYATAVVERPLGIWVLAGWSMGTAGIAGVYLHSHRLAEGNGHSPLVWPVATLGLSVGGMAVVVALMARARHVTSAGRAVEAAALHDRGP